jgi:hypothetical protein
LWDEVKPVEVRELPDAAADAQSGTWLTFVGVAPIFVSHTPRLPAAVIDSGGGS